MNILGSLHGISFQVYPQSTLLVFVENFDNLCTAKHKGPLVDKI